MRAVALVTCGLLGSIVACGSRPLETEIERHPARVLPQGASQIFYARVDRLRVNPLVVLVYEQGQRLRLGPSLKGTSQTLPLAGDIERLALGTYSGPTGREQAAVAVATGRFHEDTFRKALETFRIPYVEGRYGELRTYTCGRGEARCYVCFASPRLLVASSQEDLLKRTLDLSTRKAKSMARDRGFAPLLEGFSPETDLWVTGFFPSGLAAAFGDQMQAAIQAIQAFTIVLETDDGSRLAFVLHCDSPEAAEANAMVLKTLIAGLVQQLVVSGYSIPDLINAINRSRIVVERARTTFKLQMNKTEVAATAAALRAEPVPEK